MLPLFVALLFIWIVFSPHQNSSFQEHPRFLRVNCHHDPRTLDPRKAGDLVSSSLQFFLFEGLTRLTPDQGYQLALAESVSISPDQISYTFTLRKAYWSNGMPITASDILNTWQDMLSPHFPAPNAHLLFCIKNAKAVKQNLLPISALGVKVIDQQSLFIELESPTPYLFEILSFCLFRPSTERIPALSTSPSQDNHPLLPISNGPFRLVRWIPGKEMVVEKNPFYWNEQEVTLPGIECSFIKDEMTAWQMYEAGDLDLIGTPFTTLPTEVLSVLAKAQEIHTVNTPASTMVCFNLHDPVLCNDHIRKALTLSINRSEIMQNFFHTPKRDRISFLPDTLQEGIKATFLDPYDREQALYHLKLGLGELHISPRDLGEALSLSYPTLDMRCQIAQILQQQWRENLGISIRLIKSNTQLFLAQMHSRRYQIGLCSWYAQYSDPMTFLERLQCNYNPKNYSGFYNQRYAELIDMIRNASSTSDRSAYIEEAISILNESTPLTVLYHWKISYIQKSYVKNLYVQPTGSFYLHRVEILQ